MPATSDRPTKNYRPALLAGGGVFGVILLGMFIAGNTRKEFYTDGHGIRQFTPDARTRQILWEPAVHLSGFEEFEDEMYDPAFGADGATLVLNQGRPGKSGGADLHITRNPTGDGWQKPVPMGKLNSMANDIGAHLSADGRHLVFSSDREGGSGGYDIWYSRLTAEGEWEVPVNAGPEVNSPFNEYDPAYDPYHDTLYFASNRPKRDLTKEEKDAWLATQRELVFKSDYDIFSANRVPASDSGSLESMPDQPLFMECKRVNALNSVADEGQITLTPRGDILYFSSDRDGGFGGFDIYRVRIHNGQFREIDNIGAPVNSGSHEMDPTLTDHGYVLVFSSNRPIHHTLPSGSEGDSGQVGVASSGEPVVSARFTLYQSTSREVFIEVEPSLLSTIFDGLWKYIWWFLLALAAFGIILYLLHLLRRKDIDMGVTTKCLLASVLAHAVLAFLLSLWFITYKILEEATDPLLEANLDTDNLAQEQLALEIRETVTDMVPAVEEVVPLRAVRLDMPIPTIEPIESPDIVPPPDAFVIERQPVQFSPPIPENAPLPDPLPTLAQPEVEPIDEIKPLAASPIPFQMENNRKLAAPSPEAQLQNPLTSQNLLKSQVPTIPQTTPDTPRLEANTQATLDSATAAQAKLPPLSAPLLPDNFTLPSQDSTDLPKLAHNPSPDVRLESTRGIQAEEQPELLPAQPSQELSQFKPSAQASLAPAPPHSIEKPVTQEQVPALPSTLIAIAPERTRPDLSKPNLPSQPRPDFPRPLEPVAMKLALEATRTVEAESQPELEEAQTTQALTKALPNPSSTSASPAEAPSLDIPLTEEGILAKQHTDFVPDTPAPTRPEASRPELASQPIPLLPEVSRPSSVEVALEVKRNLQALEGPKLLEAKPSAPDSPKITPNEVALDARPEQTDLDTPDTEPSPQIPSPAVVQTATPVLNSPSPDPSRLPSTPRPELPMASSPGAILLALDASRKIEGQESVRLQDAQPDSPTSRQTGTTGQPAPLSPEKTNLGSPGSEPGSIAKTPASMPAPAPAQSAPSLPDPGLPLQPLAELPEISRPISLQLELDSSRPLLAENLPTLKDATDGQKMTKATPLALPDIPAPSLPPLELLPLPGLPSNEVPQTVLKANLPTLDAPGLPALSGPDTSIAAHLPTIDHDPRLLLESRPAEEEPFLLRDPEKRKKVLDRLGGNEDTEKAVGRALDWFSRNQEPDGHWDIQKHGGQRGHDNAATSFAVLCYFGWGLKHNEPGKYQHNINKALDWLIQQQDEDGGFTNRQHNGMYDHGVASVALAEAYGLTKDPRLREPLEKAVAFIINAQNQNHGAWDYRPGSTRIDTSVSGWQIMALRSARMAGIEIPGLPFELSAKWLDSVGSGQRRGLYGYDRRSFKTHAMVATGLFAQQLLGLSPEDPRMKESVQHLSQNMPKKHERDFYYWYYACLALYQHQGSVWEEWNARIKPVWLGLQEEHGQHAGSWSPSGGNHMGDMGRVITTALATLSLEVYYRYLPLYQTRAVTLTMQE